MQIALKIISVIVLCSSLAACRTYDTPGTDEIVKLREYRNLTKNSVKEEVVNELRYMALRNAAVSMGARAALAWRAGQINELLESNGRELDRIFNFQPLILDKNILPPVLGEGRNILTQENDQVLRLSDRSYNIIQQARFINTPVSWRSYLKMDYLEPELPDRTLLPKTGAEIEIWDNYVQDGWIAGISQAENIFTENLARLTRDLNGMLRYHSLLAQNIVSAPYVAETRLGVTGDKDKMSVNDRVLRITALPQLQTVSSENWQTEITAETK